MALAIANTPFDMPINYAKSGRAIYTWEVMQAYLPCDIEPFYIEPEEYDSRDDWHCPPGVWLGGMDPFMHWRRFYMLWSTEEEKRQDEENRHKQTCKHPKISLQHLLSSARSLRLLRSLLRSHGARSSLKSEQ